MNFLFGDQNKKEIKEYESIISEIIEHRKIIITLSDEELKNKTSEFKKRLKDGESLEDILPEAFAVAREASKRFLGKEQREVQLMGAIALHHGDVAEMKTGEGKTLTAPLAAYLNALTGKGVHIATSNDYLAGRDAEEIRPMFEGLGLTVGVVKEERLNDLEQELEDRKKAYNCDITYGSSNAFAFDYLRDNTAEVKEQIVRSKEEPGFIIIDEADKILVNDATMPFKLSGDISNNNGNKIEKIIEASIRKRQEEEIIRNDSAANAFVYNLFNDKKHCAQFRTIEAMQVHQGENKELTESSQKKYSVLFCKSQGASLTERGWLEAFKYFKGSDYIKGNPSIITDNPNFEIDKDYYIEGGQVEITLNGLEKAVKTIPEIRDLNNNFYSSEFKGLRTSIDNALKAYFVLERGNEYILEDTINNKGVIKKKVLLVSNGRTAEGRVYSGGLQQAIELKEKRLSNDSFDIVVTKDHEELASISQKAFYSIYPKIAGMTGTSARELFENVYSMNTISIPKHTEYNVSYEDIDRIYNGRIDKDTVLFETDEEKMEAVIASVLESKKKGQPVLIGTFSINDSNKLYNEFRKRGISCEKLNAENAALESKIISRAGKKGAVTISTQMAGRGTDIKLGGELELAIENEKQRIAEITASKLDAKIPLEKRKEVALNYIVNNRMGEIVAVASKHLEKEKQELIELGGLKVIGYGHFITKRDDDQLRGRAARQDDPGVTEFYTSVNDLRKNMGVAKHRIDSLHKAGLGDGSPLSGNVVDKVIAAAQANHEGMMTNSIVSTQEVDYNLSIMRKKVYDQRARMINGEETKDNMKFIINNAIVDLISKNLPKDIYNINYRKKIDNSGLNMNNFIIDVEETFGIDLTEMKEYKEGKFKKLGDFEVYLSSSVLEKYNKVRAENGDEKQNEIDRGNIIYTIDNAWATFRENLDYIKFQHSMNNLVQNESYDEILAMKKGFNQAMIDSRLQMLGKMFGKVSNKTREVEQQEVITEEFGDINDYQISEKKTYTNLFVRPAKIMTCLSNKVKLIKDKIKYQFELVEVSKESNGVENIDFDNNEIEHSSSKK